MRTASSVKRRGVVCGLTLGALLLAARPAAADLTLFERNGWSFFTDGRINSFLSAGYGDDFPAATPNIDPATGMLRDPQHTVVGAGGQLFTAGFGNDQGFDHKYGAMRVRSGFLGSIIAFGVKRQATQWTTVRSYISLWGTSESNARARFNDSFGGRPPDSKNPYKGFDVREGWVAIEGLWGSVVAGRQSGILGNISTEIDFLYGHNFGLGLPCVEPYFPTCGHIGTGALGPGFAAGFTYVTPSLGGLRIKAGLYDPVRLLGAWERVPYPRPEGAIWFERRTSEAFMFKVQVEGMYQYMAQLGEDRTDRVWGVAGGGRIEAGPFRLGLSAFRGKGLGAYIALQNAASTFDPSLRTLRYFTGVYAQTALVFGREQFSAGIGRVIDDQLDSDKNGIIDINGNLDASPAASSSNLKSQMGISGAFYHHLTNNLVLGFDYFFFRTDWWGARNAAIDPATYRIVLLPGYLKPEKQVDHFFNLGATFYW